MIYSLIGTAKLNNLDPEGYLRDVLTRLLTIRSIGSPTYCRGISTLNKKCPVNCLSGYL
jgi:IS66 C-terminal element